VQIPPTREEPVAELDWQEADEIPEDDLWFLPGPAVDEDGLSRGPPPLPAADCRALVDPKEWQAAQDALSGDLARLAQVFGELDLRLRGAGEGVMSEIIAVARDLAKNVLQVYGSAVLGRAAQRKNLRRD